MAKAKETRSDAEGTGRVRFSGLALAGGVVVVLVLAAALETEHGAAAPPAEPSAVKDPRPEAPPQAAGSGAEPRFVELPSRRTAPDASALPHPPALDARAERDRARLLAPGGAFSAQLAVLCERQSVENLLRRLGEDDRVYVVPAGDHAGRSCYRVLWGRAPSRETALAAARPVATSAGLDEPPVPHSLEKLR